MKASKLVLLLSILATFSSCMGQNNADNVTKQSGESTLGEIVSEMDYKIWSIYQDHQDNYWFGSNGMGVFLYNGEQLRQFTQKDGLVDNSIRGIQGDHLGNVFIQTPKGISKYDGKSFTTLKPITSSSNKWKLEPNDLWFNCNGSPNDIYRYDGESLFELKLPRRNLNEAFDTEVQGLSFPGMNTSPYSVFGINKDKAGNLWIGTIVAGVFRYDLSAEQEGGDSFLWIAENELSTLPDGRVPGVRSMIEDKDGNFWLSNFISRYRIHEKDSIVTYEKLPGFDMSTGLFQDRLPYFNSGLSDNEGNLWMTTYGGGVWKYDGIKLINIPIKDDTTDVLLVSIYQDNSGDFWLGTDNAGVYKINGETYEKFEPIRK